MTTPTSTAATGATVAACALAGGVFATMLAASGPLRDVAVPLLAAVQVGLHLLATRSRGPSSPRRAVVLWSVQAGLTWLVAGEPTTLSALVYIGTGLVFALLADAVLRLVGRSTTADTAPLPVGDGEG